MLTHHMLKGGTSEKDPWMLFNILRGWCCWHNPSSKAQRIWSIQAVLAAAGKIKYLHKCRQLSGGKGVLRGDEAAHVRWGRAYVVYSSVPAAWKSRLGCWWFIFSITALPPPASCKTHILWAHGEHLEDFAPSSERSCGQMRSPEPPPLPPTMPGQRLQEKLLHTQGDRNANSRITVWPWWNERINSWRLGFLTAKIGIIEILPYRE